MDSTAQDHSVPPQSSEHRSLPGAKQVDSIHASELTPAQFQAQYLGKRRPLIIHGGMDHWPAMTRWADPTYLSSVFGEKRIPIANRENHETKYEVESLSSYWENVWEGTGDRHCYLEFPITTMGRPSGLSEVASDIEFPPYFAAGAPPGCNMIAGWNTRCGMHYHASSEAVLCQVVGRKRLLLYSPEGKQFNYLYPLHWFFDHSDYSQIPFPRNGSSPDYEKFPNLRKATPYEVILEPGDMIYIPIFWWHLAYGMGTSVSIANFWVASIRDRYFTRIGLRSNYVSALLLKRHLSGASIRDRFKSLLAK